MRVHLMIWCGSVLAFFSAVAGEPVEWARLTDCVPAVTYTEAIVFSEQVILAGRGMRSEDGRNWELEAIDLRNGGSSGVVVFEGKLWSLGGGFDRFTANAEVWFSTDGIHWEEPSAGYEAPWGKRTALTAVAYDGYMWVMGGLYQECVVDKKCLIDYALTYADVWRSANGADWELVTDSAPWGPRVYHRSVVFQDKMWVLGGIQSLEMPGQEYVNDVWYSEDGETWTLAIADAPWGERVGFTLTVHEEKLWIMGGSILAPKPAQDVWSSADGVNWVLETDAAPWGRRYDHSAVSFNGELLVIGGHYAATGSSYRYHDVWALTDNPPPVDPLVWHSADQDQNAAISLSELLRVIQFYNYRRIDIAFHCDCDSEDGYDPQGGVTSCDPHTSDYNPQDWHIELNELLRLIQFFNGGGYHACPDAASEDGFCVGAG